VDRIVNPTAWVEPFLVGQVPTYVKAVPARFQELLRVYLLYLRNERKRAPTTLKSHGQSLVAFFDWLASHAPQVTLELVSSDHIAHYMAHFQSDGRVQGRNTKRDGHKKTVGTMYMRVGTLQAFFAWAKQQRLCSVNPATEFHIDWGPREVHPLPEVQVAELLRVWTDPSTHPRTAVIGLLCLVYGLTTEQIATLPLSAVDLTTEEFRGHAISLPIPKWLHPVLERYLVWRDAIMGNRIGTRFVVVQRPHSNPVSRCSIFRTLKPYGVNVRQLRDTAVAQTIQHGHLKLLTVFGLTNDAMRRYQGIARLAQNTRKVQSKPNLW
jgi:site-specific recombinase XerD